MVEYNPPVHPIGFGVAAVVMSAITFSLMVALPSTLEDPNSTLASGAEPRCTVATARERPRLADAPAALAPSPCQQPS